MKLSISKAVYEINYLQGNNGPIPILKKKRKAGKKGSVHRRLIKSIRLDGYEYTYHATKGWRKNKIDNL